VRGQCIRLVPLVRSTVLQGVDSGFCSQQCAIRGLHATVLTPLRGLSKVRWGLLQCGSVWRAARGVRKACPVCASWISAWLGASESCRRARHEGVLTVSGCDGIIPWHHVKCEAEFWVFVSACGRCWARRLGRRCGGCGLAAQASACHRSALGTHPHTPAHLATPSRCACHSAPPLSRRRMDGGVRERARVALCRSVLCDIQGPHCTLNQAKRA
jgi:hypothetical protein